ncbi:MAG: cysteine synthase A [Pseudobacteriovorax sp.]|nr:cysteine synthase A [Pseudobacteriovorax sp.]
METSVFSKQSEMIGNTSLLKLDSLSEMTGSYIYVKCENENPGGSIKDRAALGMVQAALESGQLQRGMTIVEGTAGNTGIGLTLVGKSLGFPVRVVMPRGQAQEKERMVGLFGGELHLVDPCPFRDPGHFYHTAKRFAEEDPKQFWWANQFENTDNYKVHFETTGPEIWRQTQGKIDVFVSAAGTGGTIGGVSSFLKQENPLVKTILVDPRGSGLKSYVDSGEFKSEGSSITEGIGIMRLTQNFAAAKVDCAYSFDDQDIVTVARYLRDKDGIVLGTSSALNVTAALFEGLQESGKRIVTIACDSGERSFSKFYNDEFLRSKGIDPNESMEVLLDRWR